MEILITIIIILCVILVVYFLYSIFTFKDKEKNKSILKQEILLFEDKYQAEVTKQKARIAGMIARKNIERIDKNSNHHNSTFK